jgi:hypothetical protein
MYCAVPYAYLCYQKLVKNKLLQNLPKNYFFHYRFCYEAVAQMVEQRKDLKLSSGQFKPTSRGMSLSGGYWFESNRLKITLVN